MIKSGASNVRKFEFFELIKESSVVPPLDPDVDEEGKETNIPIQKIKYKHK